MEEGGPQKGLNGRGLLALAVIIITLLYAVLDLWPPAAPGGSFIPAQHATLIAMARLCLFLAMNVGLVHALFVLIGMLDGFFLLLAPLGIMATFWGGLALRDVFYAGLLQQLAVGLGGVNASLAPLARGDGTLEPVYDALCLHADAPALKASLSLWRFIAWFQFLFFSLSAFAALLLVGTRLVRETPFRLRAPLFASALCLGLALAGSASPIATGLLPLPFAGTLGKLWSIAVETYLRDDGLKGLFWTYGCGA